MANTIQDCMRKSGLEEAINSTISKGATKSLEHILKAANGEITEDEAIDNILEETTNAAVESLETVLRNLGESDVIIQSESGNVVIQQLAKTGIKNTISGNLIAGGAAYACEAVKDLVKLGRGEISAEDCLERQGKNILATAQGLIGASVGGAGGMAIASSLGMAAGSAGAIIATLAGGLSGGLIADLAMMLAIENGVEKPYRDLVRNTENLRDAAAELTRLSETVFKSQIVFGKFLEADYALEKEFQTQMKNIDEAGKHAMEIINKI